MPQKDNPPEPRPRAFFGRRKGHKLRPRRAELLETRLPKLALDLTRPAPADLTTLFPVPVTKVALEIGFGAGENLVREAEADRTVGWIGVEPFVNGMASALALIDAAQLKNIRLHHGDVLDILEWLPQASIARINILYPDPWPKRRHWKRRFVSDASVTLLARVTMKGAIVRFATDIADYAEWALVRFLRSPAFEWTAERADDWRKPWPDHAGTRYEAKALKEGRQPSYLSLRRR
ncbi:MAG TPA: tRNA (guanine(46)-N(7))-methyltransferase TrmB [Xanthobacteraceae bacterium]|jgi:tRNA (guanine-N7-)-methyltransferase